MKSKTSHTNAKQKKAKTPHTNMKHMNSKSPHTNTNEKQKEAKTPHTNMKQKERKNITYEHYMKQMKSKTPPTSRKQIIVTLKRLLTDTCTNSKVHYLKQKHTRAVQTNNADLHQGSLVFSPILPKSLIWRVSMVIQITTKI